MWQIILQWVVLIVSLLVAQASSLAAQSADTILTGGKIVTLNPKQPTAEAIAIRDGRILALGTAREMRALGDASTKVIPLGGKMVLPGLIETHCHAIGVGRNSLVEPYTELSTIPEIQKWLKEKAKTTPKGRWITVPRTPITRLIERRHPTAAELDAGCSTHPVVFTAARKSSLNSAAFAALGVKRGDTTLPGGTGKVIVDQGGQPWILIGGDAALRKFRPRREFSDEETLAALARVTRRYNEVGITSIFERASNAEGVRLFRELHKRGQLSVRSTLTIRQQFKSGEQVAEFSKSLGLKTGDGDDWVRIGPLKITLDGGIHWGTTRLREKYGQKRIDFYRLDDPDYRGDLRYSIEQMKSIFAEAYRQGWQMCVHVTGDGGVEALLEALEAVDQEFPIHKRRFTLTHAYFPARDQIPRMKKLGMGVDTQSFLYLRDADAMAKVYGRSWAERLIGLGDWVRGGIPVATNSDHMIGLDPDHSMNSFNPFLMLYLAVSRKDEFGNVYGAHQKLSREQALRCVTTNAAWLSFDEEKKGTLEPARLADLCVIDRDYLTCPEVDIRKIKVLLTMVAGKVVFERKRAR